MAEKIIELIEEDTMKSHERKLIELQNFADSKGGGLEVLYTAHNPEVIDDIPHAWSCSAGVRSGSRREIYTGKGVTMEQAITSCWTAWQNQE